MSGTSGFGINFKDLKENSEDFENQLFCRKFELEIPNYNTGICKMDNYSIFDLIFLQLLKKIYAEHINDIDDLYIRIKKQNLANIFYKTLLENISGELIKLKGFSSCTKKHLKKIVIVKKIYHDNDFFSVSTDSSKILTFCI